MPLCIVCNSDYSESLAICPKCGFVPDASLVGAVKDEYPKHDPNLPDLKNTGVESVEAITTRFYVARVMKKSCVKILGATMFT